MKKRIENFVLNTLYEYATVYSSPEQVFEHLFYSYGNGYKLKNGHIVYRGRGVSHSLLLNSIGKDKIIQRYKDKILEYEKQILISPQDENYLRKHIESYEEDIAFVSNAEITLLDGWHTSYSFYDDIIKYRICRSSDVDYYVRPYPLEFNHSLIFKMTTAYPDKDILLIAKNLTTAWIRFLSEEIRDKHFKENSWASEKHTKAHLSMLADWRASVED